MRPDFGIDLLYEHIIPQLDPDCHWRVVLHVEDPLSSDDNDAASGSEAEENVLATPSVFTFRKTIRRKLRKPYERNGTITIIQKTY